VSSCYISNPKEKASKTITRIDADGKPIAIEEKPRGNLLGVIMK